MLQSNTQTSRKNKTILFTFILASALAFISCGDKKTGTSMNAPEGMHVMDLARYGKPFSIFVPDTVKTKLSVQERSNGALEIKAGNNFAIAINEQAADLELLKTDLKDDEVNKLKNLMVNEPSAVMWESEIVQPEFHFFINKKINNTDYSFEDIKNTEADPFGKEAVQKMFDACNSVQPNQAEK